MTHKEAARRACLMVNYSPRLYLIRFGRHKANGVGRLCWVTENAEPNEDEFKKEIDC